MQIPTKHSANLQRSPLASTYSLQACAAKQTKYAVLGSHPLEKLWRAATNQ
jgi:hypothetical protein